MWFAQWLSNIIKKSITISIKAEKITLQIFDLIQLRCPTIVQYFAIMQLLKKQKSLILSPTIRTQSENTSVKVLNRKKCSSGKYAHVYFYDFADDNFKATAATSTAVLHI